MRSSSIVIGYCGVTVGTGVSILTKISVTRADMSDAFGSRSVMTPATNSRLALSNRNCNLSTPYLPLFADSMEIGRNSSASEVEKLIRNDKEHNMMMRP
jgi:hypothetical protein